MDEPNGTKYGPRKLRLEKSGVNVVLTGTEGLEKVSKFLESDGFRVDGVLDGFYTSMLSKLHE